MAHVVIVGAGPAGATLAYLLARRGIEITLLERHHDFAREFRGEVLMPSGIDAFAQMGLAAELGRLPQAQIEAIEVYREGRRLFRVEVPAIGTAGPRVVSQPAMLEMLVEEASRYPAFHFERGATARDLVRDSGRIVGVQYTTGSGGRAARGDLVVGTDGRASLLRARAGLHEERAPQAFDIVWCKVPLPDFLAQSTARAYLGRGHAALVFPAYDERLQIGWIIAKGTFGDLRRRGVHEWVDEMAAHVSPDLAAHLRANEANITQPFLLDVVCDRLERWTCPGLLLIGDAAHPMSPVGGQGINIALRDALVAANHLCPVLTRGATAEEIDEATRRTQEERLPEVRTIQQLQQRPPPVLFGQTWWSGLVLAALPVLVRSGIATRTLGAVFRRFARGVTEVRLTA